MIHVCVYKAICNGDVSKFIRSTVKRPRGVLGPNTALNQRGACTEARPRPGRNQFHIRPYSLKRVKKTEDTKPLFSPRTLKSLKEQFQKDIEETVAEIRENEVSRTSDA